MVLSRWNGIAYLWVGSRGQRDRQRPLTKRSLECSMLDGRQLLSTLAAAPAVLPAPPATAVANAAPILNSAAPTTFPKLQNALARAEEHSHVTQAQASKLAQDEA